MKFNCNICNYSTDVKFAFEKHNDSNKHKIKVMETTKRTSSKPQANLNPIFVEIKCKNKLIQSNTHKCDYCDNMYSTNSSLIRHKKICLTREQNAIHTKYCDEIALLKNEILLLQEKNTNYQNLYEKETNITSILKSENAHLKSIVNNASSVIKTSVSTMAYVIKNYKEAPALESLKDYSAIHYEQNNTEFVDNLIYEHSHNKLHIYLSDFIIKTYKKEDPNKQSIWNSDTSRLTYLIREIITNNKMYWNILIHK
mgnify:CR=1 FL=1